MDFTGGCNEKCNAILLFTCTKKNSYLIIDSVFFCSVFRIYKPIKQGKCLFSNSNSQVFLRYFRFCKFCNEETSPRGLVLRVQNGGLTTQHDTEERRESCLISAIFDRNFSLQRGKSFNFISFYVFFHVPRRSESIRVDPTRTGGPS